MKQKTIRRRGRPKKFADKVLLHVWVERPVLEKVDALKMSWGALGQRRVSRGDVVTVLVEESAS